MTKEITVAEFNKVVKAIEHNSSFDGYVLKLGNLLEVKPIYTQNAEKPNGQELIGYDIYRYADEELMEDDDYDFDADFICSVYL